MCIILGMYQGVHSPDLVMKISEYDCPSAGETTLKNMGKSSHYATNKVQPMFITT